MNDQKIQTVDFLNIISSDTGWQLLLPGDERITKIPVAQTICEISFDNEEALKACVEALRESDERLRQQPLNEVLYNWNAVYRQDMTIKFGVLWYDRAFFEKRKDAYKSDQHISVFDKFGVAPTNLIIEHELY